MIYLVGREITLRLQYSCKSSHKNVYFLFLYSRLRRCLYFYSIYYLITSIVSKILAIYINTKYILLRNFPIKVLISYNCMSIKVLVSYIHLSIKKLIPLEYSHISTWKILSDRHFCAILLDLPVNSRKYCIKNKISQIINTFRFQFDLLLA